MKLHELFKTGTGLPSLLKGQAEITGTLKTQIEGNTGPMAKILETPLFGDGKQSRTSGMNSSPQAQAIQKQHSPLVHRIIGKKEAEAEETFFEKVKRRYPMKKEEIGLFTAAALPGLVYGATKGLKDQEQPHPNTLNSVGQVSGVGAGVGLVGSLAHRLAFKDLYGSNKGQYSKWKMPVLLATGNALTSLGFYGLGRSTHPLAHKLLFKEEQHGN